MEINSEEWCSIDSGVGVGWKYKSGKMVKVSDTWHKVIDMATDIYGLVYKVLECRKWIEAYNNILTVISYVNSLG